MSYIINTTSGNVVTTILDGTTNTQTGLTLIGRNYTGYGIPQNDNFIKLLENFADTIPPGQSVGTMPLTGTVWYDTTTNLAKVYDGANWYPISGLLASDTAPAVKNIGDQWWDTINLQLKSWTGSAWLIIGPAYTSAQGVTGTLPGTIVDNTAASRTVANTYTNGNLVSITSYGPAFTPANPIPNFPVLVSPGITVANTSTFSGTATNATTVNGLHSSQLARLDINNTLTDTYIVGNVNIRSNANLYYNNGHFGIHNLVPNGNIQFRVTNGSGALTALSIDGNTGLVSASATPVSNYNLTNKAYVDLQVSNLMSDITVATNQALANTEQVLIDYQGNIATVVNNTNANLLTAQNNLNANLNAFISTTANNFSNVTANVTAVTGLAEYIEFVQLPWMANIYSPNFLGVPTVPQPNGLTVYANSLGPTLNPYTITLSSPVTVSAGSTITQLDSTTLATISSLTVYQDVASSTTIPVTIASGTITTANSIVEINGVVQSPRNYLLNSIYDGIALAYYGLGDNSGNIATTAYVDTTANILYVDYASRVSSLANITAHNLEVAVAPLANIAAPVFTLDTATNTIYPQSVTPPAHDSSTNIATTQFVSNAIAAQQFNYTVNSTAPLNTQGNDGDFWFVIG